MWTKNAQFVKPMKPLRFENFENVWEVKKSKFENCIKWGPKICRMTREFRICPQNSNRITYDTLFGKKTVESRDFLWVFGKILRFDSFLANKWVKCCPIWILRPDSESSCHSAYLRPHLIQFSDFDFLPPIAFLKFLIARAAWVLQIQHFCSHFRYQDCLEQRKIIGPSCFMKKVVLMTHPNEQGLNWWHRDEATLTTNCCCPKQVRWWVLTDCCDHKSASEKTVTM